MKSTILRYIAGLQKPTSGEVKVRDKCIDEKCHIPMVFQSYSNFPWLSVYDNITLSLKYKGVDIKKYKDKVDSIVEKVGLTDHAKKYAQDTVLSGGQLQRIAIARSLVADPEILLMDEPFGALDLHTRFQMQLLLSELWNELEMTIIMVTHDIAEAVFLGDEIYLMSQQPARIEKGFKVDLPIPRTREMKKSREYIRIVEEVEDALYTLIDHK